MKRILMFLLLAVLLLSGCGGEAREVKTTRAVFAWDGVEESDLEILERHGINTVYLEINSLDDIKLLSDYAVFILIGDERLTLDDYESAVEKAKKAGADGIIVDQENYPTLAENLEQLDTDFPVIACVPFWLEDQDMELLTRIVQASDGIAVMAYYKENTRELVETELELCQEYGKPIVTIYELQPPGTYDLKDYNTYYNDGLQAVEDNYKSMFSDTSVGIAFHTLAMMRELDK